MSKIKAVAFDLDGTIYLGNTLIDGAIKVLEYFRKHDVEIFYFTNNSSKTRFDFLQKLTGMGIVTDLAHIYSSAYATAVFLKNHHYNSICCIGAEGLKKEINEKDIMIDDSGKLAEAVVIGLDLQFNYEKAGVVINIINDRNIPIIACNMDRNYPVGLERIMPGNGAIVSAIEFACNVKSSIIIGKPEKFMLDILCSDWNLNYNEIIVIGDSLESDIAMAKKCNTKAVLISSSNEKLHDFQVSSIDEIINMGLI